MKLLFPVLLLFIGALIRPHSASAQMQRPGSATVPMWARPFPESLVPEERDGIWLVEAKSVGGERTSEQGAHSIVEITHNYTGPDAVLGQRFVPNGPFSTGAPPFPLLPLGSKGLFVVQWHISTNKAAFMDGWVGYYEDVFPSVENFVARKGFLYFPPYAEALAFAQAIERIAKAPHNEQLRLLRAAATSPVPDLGAWAIRVLAQSGDEETPLFLLGLVKEVTLPLGSQLALDEQLQTLSSARKVRWSDTSARFDFLHRFVTSPADRERGYAILGRLLGGGQEGRLRATALLESARATEAIEHNARLFEWLRLAVNNPQWDWDARHAALWEVRRLGQRELISRNTQWDLLLSLLQVHPELNGQGAVVPKPSVSPSTLPSTPPDAPSLLARQALRYLADLRPFSADELATLRSLQACAQSPELKVQFSQFLDPATP